jgi:hypothetical protein
VISSDPPGLQGQQYWNLVSVEAQRQDGTGCTVTGAVRGNQPHIVQVRDLNSLQPSWLLNGVCASDHMSTCVLTAGMYSFCFTLMSGNSLWLRVNVVYQPDWFVYRWTSTTISSRSSPTGASSSLSATKTDPGPSHRYDSCDPAFSGAGYCTDEYSHSLLVFVILP